MSETKTHFLKTVPPYFEHVASGMKTFEVRYNDRDFRIGDRLILKEYFPNTKAFSGLEYQADIVYILHDFIGLADGYVVLGIKRVDNAYPF